MYIATRAGNFYFIYKILKKKQALQTALQSGTGGNEKQQIDFTHLYLAFILYLLKDRIQMVLVVIQIKSGTMILKLWLGCCEDSAV